MAEFPLSPELLAACRDDPERRAWLQGLPAALIRLQRQWRLGPVQPLRHDGQGSWVAITCFQAAPAVLKFGLPHFEARDEAAGLGAWDGQGCVRLLAFDPPTNALLLERCQPGTSLRSLPALEQTRVIAGLLRRLWRPAPGFRPLARMLAYWTDCSRRDRANWRDPGLVEAGLALFASLAEPSPADVLLVTDLHAGNVLAAARAPWLMIDPKPFLGDPAYDATQHLLNLRAELAQAPAEWILRFADALELPAERVRQWLFARLAAEPRADWRAQTDEARAFARRIEGLRL